MLDELYGKMDLPITITPIANVDWYYEVDGETYQHIIDPDTLQPSAECIASTVITPESAYGDALSTALLLLSPEEGMDLIEAAEYAVAASGLSVTRPHVLQAIPTRQEIERMIKNE